MNARLVLKIVLILLGAYLTIDGLGSIWYYADQPWVPDHVMRVVRTVLGLVVIYIGIRKV